MLGKFRPVENVVSDLELNPEYCAEALKALGDPVRLRIISQLRQGPCNVGDLAAALNSSIVTVSHHLGILYHAGIVVRSKRGRFVIYQLPPDVFIRTERGTEQLNLRCCQLELPQLPPQ